MTNELISKIKAEIDKLYGEYKDKFHQSGDQYHLGLIDGLDMAERVLDTLESGTTYDTHQYTPRPSVGIDDVARVQFASHAKVFDKKRKAVFDWEQFKEVAGIFYGFGKKDHSDTLESEKPMNQDKELEKEIDRYFEPLHLVDIQEEPFTQMYKCARYFAQWGVEHLATSGKTISIKPGDEVTINGHKIIYDKDKGYVTIVKSEESVPNDLEEAADKYAEKHGFRVPYDGSDNFYDNVDVKASKEGFITGAKWEKEQMMKEAVEGVVCYGSKGAYIETDFLGEYNTDVYGNPGDKVRVIVLPKED